MHPMVIIHGLFGSSKNWMSLAKAFSKRMQREVCTLMKFDISSTRSKTYNLRPPLEKNGGGLFMTGSS